MTIQNSEAVTQDTTINESVEGGTDKSATTTYRHFLSDKGPEAKRNNKLKMPTLGQLLDSKFRERKYLLSPLAQAIRTMPSFPSFSTVARQG